MKPDLKMKVCALCMFFCITFAAAANNSQCVTPVGENGTCLPVNSCEPIKNAIAYFDQDAVEFAKQSQCGYENGPLVCCGSIGRVKITSATETIDVPSVPTKPSLNNRERNSRCVTPNQENGSCIPLNSCLPIVHAMAYFGEDAMEFAKNSQCGYENGPLVCCGTVGGFIKPNATPPPRTTLAPTPNKPSQPSLRKNSRCYTPNDESGTCISVYSCGTILTSIAYFEQDAVEFAKKSQCGYENGPLVCCKSEPIVPPSTHPTGNLKRNSRCVTPLRENGTCIHINSCSSILRGIKRYDRDAIEFAKKSQCGYDNGPLVCCGSLGQVSNPQIPTKQADSGIAQNNLPCVTPNGENGNCIPVNSCSPIKQAIAFFEQDAIEFAKESQCGYEISPLVCCGSVGRFTDQPSALPLIPLSYSPNVTAGNESSVEEGSSSHEQVTKGRPSQTLIPAQPLSYTPNSSGKDNSNGTVITQVVVLPQRSSFPQIPTHPLPYAPSTSGVHKNLSNKDDRVTVKLTQRFAVSSFAYTSEQEQIVTKKDDSAHFSRYPRTRLTQPIPANPLSLDLDDPEEDNDLSQDDNLGKVTQGTTLPPIIYNNSLTNISNSSRNDENLSNEA